MYKFSLDSVWNFPLTCFNGNLAWQIMWLSSIHHPYRKYELWCKALWGSSTAMQTVHAHYGVTLHPINRKHMASLFVSRLLCLFIYTVKLNIIENSCTLVNRIHSRSFKWELGKLWRGHKNKTKCLFFGFGRPWPDLLGMVFQGHTFFDRLWPPRSLLGARNLSKKVWPWKVTKNRSNGGHTKLKKKTFEK